MDSYSKIHSYFTGLAVITVAGLLVGCGSTQLNLGPPGTIGMQRERAVIHDPYPSTDLGPPIVGGRPAGFDLPLPPTKNLQVNPHRKEPYGNRGGFVQPYNGF
jgi:hypothetical protein